MQRIRGAFALETYLCGCAIIPGLKFKSPERANNNNAGLSRLSRKFRRSPSKFQSRFLVDSTESISRSRNGSLFAIDFLYSIAIFFFHNHSIHMSLMHVDEGDLSRRVIMHSLHSLGDVWPSLVSRLRNYSAKKARYSHNRAAVYSGWPESSP